MGAAFGVRGMRAGTAGGVAGAAWYDRLYTEAEASAPGSALPLSAAVYAPSAVLGGGALLVAEADARGGRSEREGVGGGDRAALAVASFAPRVACATDADAAAAAEVWYVVEALSVEWFVAATPFGSPRSRKELSGRCKSSSVCDARRNDEASEACTLKGGVRQSQRVVNGGGGSALDRRRRHRERHPGVLGGVQWVERHGVVSEAPGVALARRGARQLHHRQPCLRCGRGRRRSGDRGEEQRGARGSGGRYGRRGRRGWR